MTEKVSPTIGPFEFDGAGLPGQTYGEATAGAISGATSVSPYLLTIAINGASQFLFENATDAEVTVAVQGPLRDAMRIKDSADVRIHIVTTVSPSSGFANDNPARRQFILPAGTRILVWPNATPTTGKVRIKLYD